MSDDVVRGKIDAKAQKKVGEKREETEAEEKRDSANLIKNSLKFRR